MDGDSLIANHSNPEGSFKETPMSMSLLAEVIEMTLVSM